jgi:hypothetical protein
MTNSTPAIDWRAEAAALRATIQAAIDGLGIAYSAEFVPQSKSRYRIQNANGQRPTGGYDGKGAPCINWRVFICRASGAGPLLAVDYSQGIAHLPGYDATAARSMDGNAGILRAVESGRIGRDVYSTLAFKPIPAPAVVDVLSCLISDADVLDCGSFEDYANCYGLDTDSRAAEKQYEEARRQSKTLRDIIGPDALDRLRDLYRNF